MRAPCCRTFVAFVLKFLIFLQAFVGVAVIVYSAYTLDRWQGKHPRDENSSLDYASGAFSSRDNALRFGFHTLPAPWFAYAAMGIGALVCCINSVGYIGAEAINGCCLSTYAILTTIFILLEVGPVAFMALDHHWDKDIPFDPTGELESLKTFIQANADIFLWVGIAVVATQILSIVFAVILRSMVGGRRGDDDVEGDYDLRTGSREPLLNPYSSQASGPIRGNSDIWSSRMRVKYGLNGGDAKHNSLDQNPSAEAMS